MDELSGPSSAGEVIATSSKPRSLKRKIPKKSDDSMDDFVENDIPQKSQNKRRKKGQFEFDDSKPRKMERKPRISTKPERYIPADPLQMKLEFPCSTGLRRSSRLQTSAQTSSPSVAPAEDWVQRYKRTKWVINLETAHLPWSKQDGKKMRAILKRYRDQEREMVFEGAEIDNSPVLLRYSEDSDHPYKRTKITTARKTIKRARKPTHIVESSDDNSIYAPKLDGTSSCTDVDSQDHPLLPDPNILHTSSTFSTQSSDPPPQRPPTEIVNIASPAQPSSSITSNYFPQLRAPHVSPERSLPRSVTVIDLASGSGSDTEEPSPADVLKNISSSMQQLSSSPHSMPVIEQKYQNVPQVDDSHPPFMDPEFTNPQPFAQGEVDNPSMANAHNVCGSAPPSLGVSSPSVNTRSVASHSSVGASRSHSKSQSAENWDKNIVNNYTFKKKRLRPNMGHVSNLRLQTLDRKKINQRLSGPPGTSSPGNYVAAGSTRKIVNDQGRTGGVTNEFLGSGAVISHGSAMQPAGVSQNASSDDNIWACMCGRTNSSVRRICSCGFDKDSAPKTKSWTCSDCGMNNTDVSRCAGCSMEEKKSKNVENNNTVCPFCDQECPVTGIQLHISENHPDSPEDGERGSESPSAHPSSSASNARNSPKQSSFQSKPKRCSKPLSLDQTRRYLNKVLIIHAIKIHNPARMPLMNTFLIRQKVNPILNGTVAKRARILLNHKNLPKRRRKNRRKRSSQNHPTNILQPA
eukprot:907874_1